MIVVLAGILSGLLVLLAARRGAGPAPGEPVVLAFGDSVAAGQGLGPSLGYPNNAGAYAAIVAGTLGWRSFNFAVSSACAATAGAAPAHPDTPAGCTRSILSDQLARVAEVYAGSPRLVVVTVGANDIRFADCGLDVIVPGQPVPAELDAPCDDDAITRRLAALDANLDAVLARIRARYPAAAIVQTAYYNPMPAPAADGEGPCPIFEPLAAVRNPLALRSDRALQDAARDLQQSVFEGFRDGVARLERTIERVAARHGARVARADFTGHDFCRSESGGSAADAWVFGPDYDVRFDATGAPFLPGGRRWRATLPAPCPDPSNEAEAFDTGEVTRRIGVVEITYEARVFINCMPHPTAAGHEALAAAVVAAAPPSIR